MLSKVPLFVCALFFPIVVAAQLQVFECARHKALTKAELNGAVDAVQKRYAALSGFNSDFVQYSFLAALEVSELSSGKVVFSKPGKMRWEYEKPDQQLFITKDQTLWLYQPADKQVLIDNFSAAFSSDLPVSFLMGLGDLSSAFKAVSGCKSEDGLVLELAPKGATSTKEEGLKTMKLLVSPKDYTPNGAQIYDVAGNINSFVFGKLEPNPEIEASTFAAQFPPGTDVIDRREAHQSLTLAQ